MNTGKLPVCSHPTLAPGPLAAAPQPACSPTALATGAEGLGLSGGCQRVPEVLLAQGVPCFLSSRELWEIGVGLYPNLHEFKMKIII